MYDKYSENKNMDTLDNRKSGNHLPGWFRWYIYNLYTLSCCLNGGVGMYSPPDNINKR
jgi:hypothetical protein